MSDAFVVDSSAWIDYLQGKERADRLREIMDDRNVTLFTTGMVVAEVCAKNLKEGGAVEGMLAAMKDMAHLVPHNHDVALLTARIYVEHRKHKPKFGLADAHVCAAAAMVRARVLTCDNDFRGMKDVLIIE